jgi:hypothetical protein
MTHKEVRLIGASSALLAAAKEAARVLDVVMGNGVYEARLLLVAAIAKAEGIAE